MARLEDAITEEDVGEEIVPDRGKLRDQKPKPKQKLRQARSESSLEKQRQRQRERRREC